MMMHPKYRLVAISIFLATFWTASVDAQELIGYWQFEETNFNEPAKDSSGKGNDGELEGEANPDVPGAPGFGSGLYVDGVDGRVFRRIV